MFDIGFWELLIVAIIGLLVLGPERLPGALRGVQRSYGSVRSYMSRMQTELNHELRIQELHEHLKKIESSGEQQLPPELQRSMAELRDAAARVQRPYASPASEKTDQSVAHGKAKDE